MCGCLVGFLRQSRVPKPRSPRLGAVPPGSISLRNPNPGGGGTLPNSPWGKRRGRGWIQGQGTGGTQWELGREQSRRPGSAGQHLGTWGLWGGSWGCPQQQEDTHGSWCWWCPAHRYPPLRAQPLRQAAGWMPGEADHRAVAVAAANEALRLIKKTSKTQKHNEEPVYQSIRGHEYANKSLNCLPAASSPMLAQIGAAGGGFQVVPGWFCAPPLVQEDQEEARGWGEPSSLCSSALCPPGTRLLPFSGQGMGGILRRGPAPAAPAPS